MMESRKPILHIVVVGFHHKKGCQVEFSYPPLIANRESTACPSGWKYLPTLGLPDGSHNFGEDSVFFNLPSLTDPNDTVYGVSCYRQISVDKLKNRTADLTRSTVQKSVCALASIPIYGYIEVKLSLIAHAFFDQGDFSSTDILITAYNQLNDCLNDGLMTSALPIHHIFVGLPLRDIILRWRYKSLILFKLMLLQKRVVCFGSPVRPICSLILSIASLHPELLSAGFQQVACVRTSRPMSPMPNFSDKTTSPDSSSSSASTATTTPPSQISACNSVDDDSSNGGGENVVYPADELLDAKNVPKNDEDDEDDVDAMINPDESRKMDKNSLTRDTSIDAITSTLQPLCSITPKTWNAPLPIFTNGNLCLPYLSLPYMDLLGDPSVLGYTIGTSNILFQQKKHLADVLVDVEGCTIETADQELKKQLTLSTEDLRFVDFIVRHVQQPREDAEGSEQWIREQFQGYMLAMLRTSLVADGSGNKELDHFNGFFMMVWKKTGCYNEWLELYKRSDRSVFEGIPSGHPFAGTLSVADMKLKIAQTMNNSESGRKLNQAVNTTSKAVGGAILHAKGAFSNWWSSLSTQPANVALINGGAAVGGILPSQQQQQQQLEPPNDENHENSFDQNVINQIDADDNDNDKHNNVEHKINGTGLEATLQTTAISKCTEGIGIIEIGREAQILDLK